MTRSEEARDKLKYWNYIDRANKVGFPIPDKWTKYGMPPNDLKEIISVNFEAIQDKLLNLFDRDDVFYKYMRGR